MAEELHATRVQKHAVSEAMEAMGGAKAGPFSCILAA